MRHAIRSALFSILLLACARSIVSKQPSELEKVAAAGATAGFSNPAAVKLPNIPARTCPVAAGADTATINAAIASCSRAGGGTVAFASGTYLVGSLHLQSHVRLQLTGPTPRRSPVRTRDTSTGTTPSSGARTSPTWPSSVRARWTAWASIATDRR